LCIVEDRDEEVEDGDGVERGIHSWENYPIHLN
jgi:hypothetical protein